MAENFWLAIGGVLVAMMLRWSGIVGSFGMVMSIAAILGGLYYLQKVPTAKLNLLSKFFVAYVAIVIALPATWNLIGARMPFTKKASEERAIVEDALLGDRLQPAVPRHLLALKGLTDGFIETEGQYVERMTKDALSRWQKGEIDYNQFAEIVVMLETKTDQDLNFQNDRREFYRKTQSSGWSETLAGIQNTPARMMFWIIGLALVIGIGAKSLMAKEKVKKIPILAIVLFALLVGGDKLIWGTDWSSASADTTSSSSTESAGVGGERHGNRYNVFYLDIVQDKPTRWIHIPPGANFNWSYDGPGDIEFEFDNGKKIVIKNGEHKNLGVLPSNNLRVKGSPGKIQITIS